MVEKITAKELIEKLSIYRIIPTLAEDTGFMFDNIDIKIEEIEKLKSYKMIATYHGMVEEHPIIFDDSTSSFERKLEVRNMYKHPQNMYTALVSYVKNGEEPHTRIIVEYEKGDNEKGVQKVLEQIVEEYIIYKDIKTVEEMDSYIHNHEKKIMANKEFNYIFGNVEGK